MIKILLIIVITGSLSCNTPVKEFNADRRSIAFESASDTLKWSRPRFSERKEEREKMVVQDIQNSFYNPVRDIRVLEAMKAVPRHLFVPKQLQANAYGNYPLAIGMGQTISQPIIVAHMTELLEIEVGHKILEIGTGSGYQAAVLSELTPNVYSIEIVEKLGELAIERFKELGYHTIQVKIGDGYEGWDEHAPFDGIIVTCAPEEIPPPLIRQLKPGGKIVIPVGAEDRVQNLIVVTKDEKGNLKKKSQYPVRFVPMTGKAKKNKK